MACSGGCTSFRPGPRSPERRPRRWTAGGKAGRRNEPTTSSLRLVVVMSVAIGFLRDQAWGASSDARGSGNVPGDTGVEQERDPVVGKVGESVAGALDLLDD